MASVSEQLRQKVYGSATPSQSQINAVREKANTLAPGAQEALDRRTQTANTVKPVSSQPSEPFWKTWFTDKSTNDTVVDSTTGQVIQVNKPSALGGTIKGAGKSAASDYTNVGGSIIEGLGHLNTSIASKQDTAQINKLRQDNARYQQMLDSGMKLDGTPVTAQERQNFSAIIDRNERLIGEVPASTKAQEQRTMEAAQKFYDTADRLDVSAQEDIAQAKEGLGKLGQFAVDAGVAGTQLAGDIGFSLLTGGSALVPMAVRAFGSGAQEARQSGASYGQQLAYGAGSAALSAATEKISNVAAPFAKAFGAGVADKLAGKLVNRFGESAAVKTMSKLSQTSAGRLAASALGEGSEEFVEAVFQPVLQRATYDSGASFDLGQALYDAAIGAALGGIGGAVDIGMRRSAGTAEGTTENGGAADAQTQKAGIQSAQNAAPVSEAAVNENGLTALTDQEKINLSSGKRNKVISTFSDAVSFIKNALADKSNVDRAYLGKVPDNTARRVFEDTGIDIIGYQAILPSDNVRHIIKNHGDAASEAARGQSAVTADDIALIPQVLSAPDHVRLSPNRDSRGRNVLVFEKRIGDQYVTMQAVSDGTHSLQTDTLYKQKRKDPHVTEYYDAGDVTSPAHNARSVPPQGLSNSNFTIPQGAETVNSDPLLDALLGGRRVDQQKATNRQFDALGGFAGGAADPVVNRIKGSPQDAQAAGKDTNAPQTSVDAPAAETPVQDVTGQNKTAPEMGAAVNKGETVQVVENLRSHIPNLQGMNPVSTVSVNSIPFVEGKTMAEKARRLFDAIKGVVTRPGFGDVDINGRSVKDDLSHGVGAAKAAVIPAIPEIIRQGKQIDFQENWKGRAYDGYVFAAPVTIDGHTAYVAAVVKRTSKNRFYLHEVIDADGNVIKIDAGESANQTSLAANGDAGTHSPASIDLTPAKASLAGPAPAASSETSSPVEGTRPLSFNSTIPQRTENVNSGDGLGAADAAGRRKSSAQAPTAPVQSVEAQTENMQPPPVKVNYDPLEAQAIRKDAKTFRNLVAGFDTKVSDFFQKWRGGRVSQNEDKLEKLYLSKMPEAVRRQVSSILGYEVEQRDFIVTNDDVKHIFDRHGDAAAEIKGNNIPLEQWMFDALPDVVTSPDTIEPGKIGKGKKNAGKQSVIFKKAFPGGTVVTVQFDNKGRGTMEINTMYAKENEDTSSKLDTATGTAPNSTSETLEPVSSSNFIIPQGAETVNSGEGLRPGTRDGMIGTADGQEGAYGSEVQTDDGDLLREDRRAKAPDAGRIPAIPDETGGIGRPAHDQGADSETHPGWARGHLIDHPSQSAKIALESAGRSGAKAYVVEDAAIKAANPAAWALTSGGKIYLSDSIPADLADVVGFHEAVHAAKQKGTPEYLTLLSETAAKLNPASARTEMVLNLLAGARMSGKQFVELTQAEADIVFDELNALVWGFYKANPENARAQFAQIFQDYDAYIGGLDAAMESMRQGEDGIGAADAGSLNTAYDNLQAQSSRFYPEGANAARPVDVPMQDFSGRNVSKSASTVMGAKAIPDDVVPLIEQMVADGKLSYDMREDEASVSAANKAIEGKGFDGALEEFRNAVNNGKVSKDIVTLGQELLNNAANAKDGDTVAELLVLYQNLSTNAGQALQAMSIFRKLSPNSQLYGIRKTVDNLNAELKKVQKAVPDVTISQELVTKFLEQTDQAGRDAVMQEIYQNVADQVPSTWRDKWNAWRYLSMLGNPRTHIRNIAGNVGFQPLRMVKNGVATAIEAGLESAGVQMERTKSFGVSPALYRAAWNDYSNAKSVLSGSKYNDAKSQINDRRRVFSNSALEAARKGNSAALEFEDAIFKRITYADSLAGYLKANGVTASQLESGNVDAGLLSRARDYAGKEALKATYQDRNKVSDSVVKIANDLGVVGEAILPFKRTPANILVRAAEYSPIGVAKSIYDGATKVKNGNKSIGEVIDEAAAGLTGSGLLALGAYMFASGMVTGAQGDDKDDKWAELLGHQGYALELEDGTSITLDWLAPESLPFFMGVELMSAAGENGLDAESVWDAIKATANPMLELSMLQSVNDLIESAQYAEDAPLSAMIPSAIVSYFSQAVPTLGGQIERTGESERMMTYTDKNSSIPTDLQYAIGRASSRIPGWDYQQIPYIDEWGRTESSGDPILNAANNFLNPAYTSQVEVDAVEKELQAVRDATGDTAVFPAAAQRYIEVDGERKDLTAEEYQQYARKLGTERYSLLQEAMQTSEYKSMSAQEKADYISDLYSYAGAVAKADVSSYQLDGWQKNASTARQDIGVSPAEYIALYQKYGSSIMSGKAYEKTKQAVGLGLSVDQYAAAKDGMDANGNGSITQAEARAALDRQDLTTGQKADLWTIINSSWKTNPYR